MGFPEGAQTTVLTMKLGLVDGAADRETVTSTPSPSQIVSTALNDIREGDPVEITPDRSSGTAQVRLLNTDASGYNPSGWTYAVKRGNRAPYNISLPHSLGATADLADLTEVSESPGVYDVLLPASELGTAAFADIGTAGGTVAAGNDSRLGTIGGIPIGGTPAAGKVPQLTSPTAGAWTTPAAGGGGSSVRTASVRITDDNLGGLPSAASWTVVLTSAGTPLQASIAAVDGDRIRVCASFMRNGGHFVDWVVLASGGAIDRYATTGTGTAPTEGNPSMYPSLSFSYVTCDDMFTVASGNINAGMATIALAHQGVAAGIVYAHPTYPWRLRLENIGPEPA